FASERAAPGRDVGGAARSAHVDVASVDRRRGPPGRRARDGRPPGTAGVELASVLRGGEGRPRPGGRRIVARAQRGGDRRARGVSASQGGGAAPGSLATCPRPTGKSARPNGRESRWLAAMGGGDGRNRGPSQRLARGDTGSFRRRAAAGQPP